MESVNGAEFGWPSWGHNIPKVVPNPEKSISEIKIDLGNGFRVDGELLATAVDDKVCPRE